ncbi:MAG: DUF1569 domain-containing protein [Pyrinomonadaceae bacterium]|nr:DUF1569 domain-containing protein [Pyrinomonadaceae bacterium]MBP6211964.1 DUF1569 domain-containing protein [Pyrinomonadaceae bacterium]
MAYPNIFEREVSDGIIARLNSLTPESQRRWGKMDVARMLAHLNVSYEMIFEPERYPRPNAVMRLIVRYFVKGYVTGDKPLKHNSPTAPQFIMKSDKDFDAERKRLIDYINRTREFGEDHFDGREYVSFGVLSKTQYSNMLYKHLDHHLQQFGA